MAKRKHHDPHEKPAAGRGSESARKAREQVLKSVDTPAIGNPTAGRQSPPAKITANDREASKRRLFRELKIGLAIGLLVGAIFATYRESRSGRLFFDDHPAIERNANLRALVNPTTRWKPQTWLNACSSHNETPLSGRPVASLSFALNYWWASTMHPSLKPGFDGLLPAHIPYFHYVNLAIHMGVAILLFLLVRRTMTAPNFGEAHRATADQWGFFVALVWAVHPLNTETVVYLTQRTEQIVSFFLLLTLYCSARAFDAESSKGRFRWYLAAVAACLLGMGSKENMIVAPLLVVAYDRAFNYRDWRSALSSRLPFYLALAATWFALGAIIVTNPRGKTVGFHDPRLPWYEYLITQCWCLWRYFWLTVVPLGGKLCVDYGRRPVLEFHHTAPGAMLVFALLGTTIWGWLRKPWIGFLGVCFFFILAPTSSFYPIITEVGAERRMYLPSAAILVALIAGVVAIFGRLRTGEASPSSASSPAVEAATIADEQVADFAQRMRVGLGLALIPIAWLAYTSYQRTRVYQDDLAIYKHIVDVFPDNDRGCSNYGTACMGRGLYEEALNVFNRALKIDPEYVDALANRASVYLEMQRRNPGSGRIDMAIADATDALNWQWFNNVGLNNRGAAYIDAGQYDRAEADFETLAKIHPLSGDVKFKQALLFSRRGDDDPQFLNKALTAIDDALRLSPGSYLAYSARGDVFIKMKRYDEAIMAYRQAIAALEVDAKEAPPTSDAYVGWKAAEKGLAQITPSNRSADPKLNDAAAAYPNRVAMASVYGNLGLCYEQAAAAKNDKGYLNGAIEALSKAAFLDAANPSYHTLRGELFLKNSRFGDAFHDFDAALMQNRYYVDALYGRLKANAMTANYPAARADALTLQKLRVPLDAEKSALIAEVLAKSATP